MLLTDLLSMDCSGGFLIHKVHQPSNGSAEHTQSSPIQITMKTHHGFDRRLVWCGYFVKWDYLFPNDTGLH